jgi:O-antigen/teichoic acid export membrane protein
MPRSFGKASLWRPYRQALDDPLYRNAAYLILSTASMGVLGIGYWLIVARLFPAAQVGLATTTIAVLTLLANLSVLGLNSALVRYLPSSSARAATTNAALTVVGGSALVVSAGALYLLPRLAPALQFVASDPARALLFPGFAAAAGLGIVVDSVFVASRSAGYVLIKSTVFSLVKLALPFGLLALGAYGIFLSYALAAVASLLLALWLLAARLGQPLRPSWQVAGLVPVARYSLGNYAVGIFLLLPTWLLPVLIVDRLSPPDAAFFSVASTVANLLTIVPTAVGQALLAEGAHDPAALRHHSARSLRMVALLLGPAVAVVLGLGTPLLQLFGPDYARGSGTLLRLLAVASLFVAVSLLGISILNVRQRVRTNVLLAGLNAALVLGLSRWGMSAGLAGIGGAWLLGQGLSALAFAWAVWRALRPAGTASTPRPAAVPRRR